MPPPPPIRLGFVGVVVALEKDEEGEALAIPPTCFERAAIHASRDSPEGAININRFPEGWKRSAN